MKIKYPYSKFFAKPIPELFQNLINYQPSISNKPYKFIYGVQLDFKKYPLTFKGKFTTVIHESTYLTMDIITDYFTQEARVKCSVRDNLSPLDYWNKYSHIIIKYLEDNNMDITPYNMSEVMYSRVKDCTLFKVSLVKAVLQILNFPKRVLDFSSGWGDRLIGCAASGVQEYTGFDPNLLLKKGHTKIIKTFAKGKKYKVFYQPFEDSDVSDLTVDLVFTSPPYFDFESYSKDNKQSMIKFNNYYDWLNGFLFVALQKSWNCLAKNGYLAIHIQDTKTMPLLCQKMNNFISTLQNSKYLGVIGSEGASGKIRPIWIWQKI